MKFGAGPKQTGAAALAGHAGWRLCAAVPVVTSAEHCDAELSSEADELRCLLQQPQAGSSSGYHRAIRTCLCPSVLVNNPHGHPYCECQALHIPPALRKGTVSFLASSTNSSKTLSQIVLHPRGSFTRFHYKLRLLILIFSLLVSISDKEKQHSAVTDGYS